jgi:hypothetical protein
LKKLCIPASVEELKDGTLPDVLSCEIEVADGNRSIARRGDCLIDLNDHSLLRYLGSESEVEIPDEVETIGEGCFPFCENGCAVRFGPASRLSSIGARAFFKFRDLKAISIPSSVAFLGDRCFAGCTWLATVSFCAGSTLSRIGDRAFEDCSHLDSIILPSTVKTLGRHSFAGCQALESSPLPIDSQIVRIESNAFYKCSSLTSMFLPTSAEFLGGDCFNGCGRLSCLTFASPSHLRELNIPSVLSGFVSIPDSVEILSFSRRGGGWGHAPTRIFDFGVHSQLREIQMGFSLGRLPRAFLQTSAHSLKSFRTKLEFEAGGLSRMWFKQPRD